jgi:hypothetical protein
VFVWLTNKLQEPLVTAELTDNTTPTTIPGFCLSGPFDSSVAVSFAEALGLVRSDVFVQFAIDEDDPITLAVAANAGRSVSSGATLRPTVSMVMRLIGANEEVLDTTRIAPPPLPAFVESIPAVAIDLGPSSIIAANGGATGSINPLAVEISWVDGGRTVIADPEPADTNSIEIAVLTSEIGVAAIGGRRGPITAFAVLLVGSLILLAVVIVSESWRRAKIAAETQESVLPVADEAAPVIATPDVAPPNVAVADVGATTPRSEAIIGPRTSPDPAIEERDFAGRP